MSEQQVTVKVETAMLGVQYGQRVTVARTRLVQAAIDDGRLTIVEQPGEPTPELKGEALDQALRRRELPLTGSADEKRAAVAAWDAEHPDGPSTDQS